MSAGQLLLAWAVVVFVLGALWIKRCLRDPEPPVPDVELLRPIDDEPWREPRWRP